MCNLKYRWFQKSYFRISSFFRSKALRNHYITFLTHDKLTKTLDYCENQTECRMQHSTNTTSSITLSQL